MKRISAILLTATLAASALSLASCNGDKSNTDGENGDALTVIVSITDKVDGKDIIFYAVPFEEGTSVLEYTVTACASNGIAYELSDDDKAFESIDGRYDYYYSANEDSKYWHYLLNGHDGIDENDYEPSTKTAQAGDTIYWVYSDSAE